ncbi:putative thymidylate kinase [uncultured archaeon]|nr:putative thymidylate kinase [uncultured archaeon]
MFIVLEGVDGCGKSTQAKLLGEYLKGLGKLVVLTAEPSKSMVGVALRQILRGDAEVDARTLALLFTADRMEHLKAEILPALESGKIVVCERYVLSTVAYQAAQGVDAQWILELNRFAPKPDVSFLLEADPKTAAARAKSGEIFEREDFLKRVTQNYYAYGGELIRIPPQSVDKVQAAIRKVVAGRI